MNEQGYILLHKQMLNWQWYQDKNTKIVFLHLLLKANYSDQIWQGIMIHRGQRVISYRNLADELQLTLKETRIAISHLEATGEIILNPQPRYTIVTITNYDLYQKGHKQGHTEPTIEGTTKGTTKGTNSTFVNDNNTNIYEDTDNIEGTTKGTNKGTLNEQSGAQTRALNKRNIKEEYNKKNIKENIKESQLLSQLPSDVKEIVSDWLDYKKTEYRQSYKSEKSLQAFINRLNQLADGKVENMRAIIDQSMANKWQGIFQLKNNYASGNSASIDDGSIYSRIKTMPKYEEDIEVW